MVIGHLAVSALEHRYLKADLPAVMAAAVVPDAVDKLLHYALKLAPTGRLWGHTLLGLLASTLLVYLLWGRRVAASWALGYSSHLLCDVGGVVPWLYPFATYEFPERRAIYASFVLTAENLPRLALELGLSIWAIAALRRQTRGCVDSTKAWWRGRSVG